jgi:hypothetical protein
MTLTEGTYVITRQGTLHGPLLASPMWDNVFFAPDGYHWKADGTLLGFEPGGLLDVVGLA